MPTYTFENTDFVKFDFYNNGTKIGEIYLPKHGNGLYLSNSWIRLSKNDITSDFFDYLFDYCKEHEFTVVSYESENEIIKFVNGLLKNSKFKYDADIVYYVKEQEPTPSSFKDEFAFEHYQNRGNDFFIETLKNSSSSDPYYKTKSIEETQREWDGYDKSFWKLAFKNDRIVGTILPFRNLNFPEIGNIAYIGVVPEQRGNEYGHKLHNIALDILFNEIKVSKYLGMTHKDNKYMINIFGINHCILQKEIVFNAKE